MEKKIADLFGIPHAGNATFPVKTPGTATPARLDSYAFRAELLRPALMWLAGWGSKNLYLAGPTGAGKSSFIEQVAARTGHQVFRHGCHERTEYPELVGHIIILKDGSTGYAYGPLPMAMREGGILLLDEVDQTPPSTAMGLNGVLDGAPLLIPETGELIQPHPDFRIAVTGNSNGTGDITGLYKGVRRQNIAWMDRFAVLQVDYLEPAEEEAILAQAVPQLPEKTRNLLVRMANEVRVLVKGGSLETPLTTRSLVEWAAYIVGFEGSAVADPVIEGMKLKLLNRASEEDAKALLGIWQRIVA